MDSVETASQYRDYMLMVVEILHTGNWLDNKISKVLATVGITHVQFNILRILQGSNPEPLSVGDVKSRILFSKCDITRLLDRLKDKGLIDRNVNPNNRRRMDVIITKEGLELIEDVLPKIEDELDGFFHEKISEKDRIQMVENLKKLRED